MRWRRTPVLLLAPSIYTIQVEDIVRVKAHLIFWLSVLAQTVKAWPIDPLACRNLTLEVSRRSYHRDNLACGSQAFIATLLFDPSMSALPIIAKQDSPSVGLFTHQ
ncbi:unnamed protein product [Bathycoccus prasinos]